jgi:hypothetical protein
LFCSPGLIWKVVRHQENRTETPVLTLLRFRQCRCKRMKAQRRAVTDRDEKTDHVHDHVHVNVDVDVVVHVLVERGCGR